MDLYFYCAVVFYFSLFSFLFFSFFFCISFRQKCLALFLDLVEWPLCRLPSSAVAVGCLLPTDSLRIFFHYFYFGLPFIYLFIFLVIFINISQLKKKTDIKYEHQTKTTTKGHNVEEGTSQSEKEEY